MTDTRQLVSERLTRKLNRKSRRTSSQFVNDVTSNLKNIISDSDYRAASKNEKKLQRKLISLQAQVNRLKGQLDEIVEGVVTG
jgi:peptidoglycan hydrolase CwlO-like protein